jgi:hypothetical protein
MDSRGLARTRQIAQRSHKDIRLGLFTPPVAIGVRARGWPEDETETLNAAQIAGKTDEEIRRLVCRLKAARTFEPEAAV